MKSHYYIMVFVIFVAALFVQKQWNLLGMVGL